jgi:3'-phosphoadenosine 5'-phosphosulfate (PAPS) 3'-phosphatase
MKIFGIGLSKTGTTSLSHALEILGYRTKDNLGVVNYAAGDLSSLDTTLLEENDAFTDTPIPSFYQELDKEYPGSKFILTTRNMDGWLKSCKKQFTQKHADKQNTASNLLFMDLYGCTVFDEQKFKKGYQTFVDGVTQYFRDRQHDLLIQDVTTGEGWEKLCPFLETPIPDIPFPRANVTTIRWMDINEIVTVARLAGEKILKAYETIQANDTDQRRDRTKQPRAAGSILNKVGFAIRGGAEGTQRAATKNANTIILKRLKELSPQIPVISRKNHVAPYSDRNKWNHFWLVDPLDIDKGLFDSNATFALSITLIEDRKPILGVVCAPGLDTIYYAMTGKGAFKIEHGGEPRCIEPRKKSDHKLPSPADPSQLSFKSQQENRPAPASKALAMCLVAEGTPDICHLFEDTMEWQTAGAHAIVNSAGMKITSSYTKKELTYNKEQLSNDAIIIE